MSAPDQGEVIKITPVQAFLLYALAEYLNKEGAIDAAAIGSLLMLLADDITDWPEGRQLSRRLPDPTFRNAWIDLDGWLEVMDDKVRERLMDQPRFYRLNANGLRVGRAIGAGRDPGDGYGLQPDVLTLLTPRLRGEIARRIERYRRLKSHDLIGKARSAFGDAPAPVVHA